MVSDFSEKDSWTMVPVGLETHLKKNEGESQLPPTPPPKVRR